MSVVQELVAAIEADPRDEAPQLVIADHLQAVGDPRGDLIVLDHAERRGRLTDPAAIEQLLLLAAEYTFPRAEPDEPPLSWRSPEKNHFYVRHAGTSYELWLADDVWNLEVDPPDGEGFEAELRDVTSPLDERVLEILGDVIRAGAPFDGILLALDGFQVPQYDGGPLRCYRLPLEFTIPRGFLRNRFGLAARDYVRWHAIWRRLDAMQPADEF